MVEMWELLQGRMGDMQVDACLLHGARSQKKEELTVKMPTGAEDFDMRRMDAFGDGHGDLMLGYGLRVSSRMSRVPRMCRKRC